MSAPRPARTQRGVALLTAIMLVALGTMLAAAIAYSNAMTARRGQALFVFDQSILIAEAGEALAAYGLRATRKNDPTHVYPGQAWSMPFTFEVVPGVTLQLQLEDLQGRFNLNSLVTVDGKVNEDTLTVFENLLQLLGLESKWGPLIADWIDADEVATPPDGAEDSTYLSQLPPYRTPNTQITSASELLALPGFGRDRYLKLAPFVTALPRNVGVNLCTARGVVLDAYGPAGQTQWSHMSDDQLQKERQARNGCLPTTTEFNAAYGETKATQKVQNLLNMTSNYFRLTSVTTIGTTQFALYSLLHQEGDLRVRPVQRSFTAD